MFMKKQICSKCKTGKTTYGLDPKSECCPYIEYWEQNKCKFYKPLGNAFIRSLLVKLKKICSLVARRF